MSLVSAVVDSTDNCTKDDDDDDEDLEHIEDADEGDPTLVSESSRHGMQVITNVFGLCAGNIMASTILGSTLISPTGLDFATIDASFSVSAPRSNSLDTRRTASTGRGGVFFSSDSEGVIVSTGFCVMDFVCSSRFGIAKVIDETGTLLVFDEAGTCATLTLGEEGTIILLGNGFDSPLALISLLRFRRLFATASRKLNVSWSIVL